MHKSTSKLASQCIQVSLTVLNQRERLQQGGLVVLLSLVVPQKAIVLLEPSRLFFFLYAEVGNAFLELTGCILDSPEVESAFV